MEFEYFLPQLILFLALSIFGNALIKIIKHKKINILDGVFIILGIIFIIIFWLWIKDGDLTQKTVEVGLVSIFGAIFAFLMVLFIIIFAISIEGNKFPSNFNQLFSFFTRRQLFLPNKINLEYNNLNRERLIEECKLRNIKVNW